MKTIVCLCCLVTLFVGTAARADDVADLIRQLKDRDPGTRRDAASGLAEMGSAAKPAVSALTVALKDKDLFVRRFAAKALGNIGPDAKAALPALNKLLKDEK